MIVVLGRPGLTADGGVGRLAGEIALATASNGGRVEVVGSVGDDADGDEVVVQLGGAGIGHAALLRDPAGTTPRDVADGGGTKADGRLPRLDAGDVDLGLRYLADVGVLIVAEPLPDDALAVAAEAAAYHRAPLIVLRTSPESGNDDAVDQLLGEATVLDTPADDRGAAFAQLVARYATNLDSGAEAGDAWREAVERTGWESPTE